MLIKHSNTTINSRTKHAGLLAMLLLSFFNPSAALAITIPVLVSNQCGERGRLSCWDNLQTYLNSELNGSNIVLDFKVLSQSEILQRIAKPENKSPVASILAPFRYVLADIHNPNLRVIARMRRPNLVDGTPIDHYRSVIYARKYQGVWPPVPGEKLTFFSAHSHSTSGFIYPLAYFNQRKAGWGVKIAPLFADMEADQVDPWKLTSVGIAHTDATIKAASNQSDWSLFATADDKFERLRRSEESLRDDSNSHSVSLLQLLDPIPFDPLLIANASDAQYKKIKAAFLSLQYLTETELESALGILRARVSDWVDVDPRVYNSVKKTAVIATGGVTVRLGLSPRNHPIQASKRSPYLNNLQRRLLSASAEHKRHFLEMSYLPPSAKQVLAALEAGTIDVAELSAAVAAEALGQGHGLMGQTVFAEAEVPAKSYKFVLLGKVPDQSYRKIAKGARFAYTKVTSASGYLYPKKVLRAAGVKITKEQLIRANNADGVLAALRDGRADYGFMANFDWSDFKQDFPNSAQLFHAVDLEELEDNIPNGLLVVSKKFCRNRNGFEYGAEPNAKEKFFGYLGFDAAVLEQKTHCDAIESLKQSIKKLASSDSSAIKIKNGFLRYETAKTVLYTDLLAIYHANRINPLLIISAALGLFVGGIAILAVAMRRFRNAEEGLSLGLDAEQALVDQSVEFLALLKGDDALVDSIFGGLERRRQLDRELGEKVLDILVGNRAAEPGQRLLNIGKLAHYIELELQPAITNARKTLGIQIQDQKKPEHAQHLEKMLNIAEKVITLAKAH